MDRARLHRLERGDTSGDLDVTMDSDEDTELPVPAPARGRGRGGRARGGRGRARGQLATAKWTQLRNNLGIKGVVSVCYACAHGNNSTCETDCMQSFMVIHEGLQEFCWLLIAAVLSSPSRGSKTAHIHFNLFSGMWWKCYTSCYKYTLSKISELYTLWPL